MTSAAEYAALARAHLPQALAERWISLLRPAIEFSYEPVRAAERIALRVGGDPALPDEMPWPELADYGPMIFMADMDCAAVAEAGGVDLLPTSGHLLFFFAGHPDRYPERWSGRGSGPMEWEQGRVIYLSPGTPRRPRPCPEPDPDPDDWFDPIEPEELPAQLINTPPDVCRELLERDFGTDVKEQFDHAWARYLTGRSELRRLDFPLWADEFEHAVKDEWGYIQTGGHAHDVQRPPALLAARSALGPDTEYADERNLDEAQHWRLLFQTGWEAGDSILYWMIRDDDLAAGRFDRIWFGAQR